MSKALTGQNPSEEQEEQEEREEQQPSSIRTHDEVYIEDGDWNDEE